MGCGVENEPLTPLVPEGNFAQHELDVRLPEVWVQRRWLNHPEAVSPATLQFHSGSVAF